jgi:hypothetical protein
MSAETDARVLPEVVMTDELAAAIQAAVSTDAVRGLLIAEAEKQLATTTQLAADQSAAEQAVTDKAAADAAAAAEIAKANQVFTRTEIIGGKEFQFSASTEGELDRQVLGAYKVAYAVQQPVERVAEVDPEAAAKAAEAEVLAKAELERKFKLGEISAKEYIEQSGAVNEFLAAQGISVDSLKTVVEKSKADAVHQSWASASETFRTSTVGSDWPGGVKNRQLLGDKLAALGLVDADDKVAAMAQAWSAMKESGAYFPNGDEAAPVVKDAAVVDPAVAAKAAADAVAATAATAARTAAAAKVKSMSSSLFGASSGTSSAPVLNPAVIAAKQIVPDNASPQEILDAWKAEQVKNGQNPDDAFTSTFGARRV